MSFGTTRFTVQQRGKHGGGRKKHASAVRPVAASPGRIVTRSSETLAASIGAYAASYIGFWLASYTSQIGFIFSFKLLAPFKMSSELCPVYAPCVASNRRDATRR